MSSNSPLTPPACAEAVSKLALIAFFPDDPDTRAALIWFLMQFVETEEQLTWLVERTTLLYARWPGVAELRAVYCSRFNPKDGINAYSTVYPDGFPTDPTAPRRIAPPKPKRLERGEPVTADPDLQAKVEHVAEKRSMPPAISLSTRFAKMLREIETPPHLRQRPEQPTNLDFKPVTQEDIARAVEELHARKETP